MKTSIINRNNSHKAIIEKLPEKRRVVYAAIAMMGKCTAQMVARHLNVPINEVTGRITELRDKHNAIREAGSIKNQRTGKLNTLYTTELTLF